MRIFGQIKIPLMSSEIYNNFIIKIWWTNLTGKTIKTWNRLTTRWPWKVKSRQIVEARKLMTPIDYRTSIRWIQIASRRAESSLWRAIRIRTHTSRHHWKRKNRDQIKRPSMCEWVTKKESLIIIRLAQIKCSINKMDQ